MTQVHHLHYVIGLLVCLSTTHLSANALKACYGDWQPYIYHNQSGQVVGIAQEMLSTAVADIGKDIEYINLPYKRCVSEVNAGRLDIAMFLSPDSTDLTESRTVFAYWTLAAIARTNDPLQRLTSLDQLSNRRVLVIDNYDYPGRLHGWLSHHPEVLTINYGAELEDGYLPPYRMIEAGRADIFIEDMFWSQRFIEKHQLKLRVVKPAIAREANTIGFREGLSRLRDRIDTALMKRGEEFREALFRKYTRRTEAAFVGHDSIEPKGSAEHSLTLD